MEYAPSKYGPDILSVIIFEGSDEIRTLGEACRRERLRRYGDTAAANRSLPKRGLDRLRRYFNSPLFALEQIEREAAVTLERIGESPVGTHVVSEVDHADIATSALAAFKGVDRRGRPFEETGLPVDCEQLANEMSSRLLLQR